MIFLSVRLVTVLFIIFGIISCKNTESARSESTTADDSAVTNTDSLEAKYWAQIERSRMDFTEADVNFMIGMISHHAQALIMSRLAPENDASPQVRTLAARIINAQQDEIASMQTWLQDRGEPVPEVHIEGLNLMIHGLGSHHQHADHTNMPGMLSPEQLQELENAKGAEFDRLFLKYMIEHHQGAVFMVKELFTTDGAAQDEEAFRLASDIQVDQITEIERMKLMLGNLSDS